MVLNGVAWFTGLIVVLIIVFIGIFFDMLGIAATAADETPFHAMAAKRYTVPATDQDRPECRPVRKLL